MKKIIIYWSCLQQLTCDFESDFICGYQVSTRFSSRWRAEKIRKLSRTDPKDNFNGNDQGRSDYKGKCNLHRHIFRKKCLGCPSVTLKNCPLFRILISEFNNLSGPSSLMDLSPLLTMIMFYTTFYPNYILAHMLISMPKHSCAP